MSQMDVPTKADITRRIKEIEKAAKEELEGLKARAPEAMQNPQPQEVDPAQPPQAFQQGQQPLLPQHAPTPTEPPSHPPLAPPTHPPPPPPPPHPPPPTP